MGSISAHTQICLLGFNSFLFHFPLLFPSLSSSCLSLSFSFSFSFSLSLSLSKTLAYHSSLSPSTHPEASGGNLTTTLPISAPGSSTNFPTSACFVFCPCNHKNKHSIIIMKDLHSPSLLLTQTTPTRSTRPSGFISRTLKWEGLGRRLDCCTCTCIGRKVSILGGNVIFPPPLNHNPINTKMHTRL